MSSDEIIGLVKYMEGLTKAVEIVRSHMSKTGDPRVVLGIMKDLNKEVIKQHKLFEEKNIVTTNAPSTVS